MFELSGFVSVVGSCHAVSLFNSTWASVCVVSPGALVAVASVSSLSTVISYFEGGLSTSGSSSGRHGAGVTVGVVSNICTCVISSNECAACSVPVSPVSLRSASVSIDNARS